MPIKIVISGVLPGLIISTIRYSSAMVATSKDYEVHEVIHEVLKFFRTLTKLSPIIKCDVSIGGCCMFTAGIYVDRVKQARVSVSRTPVKWFITWLFFCVSNTRDTFFLGTFFIFLSGAFEIFIGLVVVSAPVLLVVSWASSTLPVSSIVP